jgi:hypothetical protein
MHTMTADDFARIFGYTAQVAAAFISAAACLDAIISYSRAYGVYTRRAADRPPPVKRDLVGADTGAAVETAGGGG